MGQQQTNVNYTHRSGDKSLRRSIFNTLFLGKNKLEQLKLRQLLKMSVLFILKLGSSLNLRLMDSNTWINRRILSNPLQKRDTITGCVFVVIFLSITQTATSSNGEYYVSAILKVPLEPLGTILPCTTGGFKAIMVSTGLRFWNGWTDSRITDIKLVLKSNIGLYNAGRRAQCKILFVLGCIQGGYKVQLFV